MSHLQGLHAALGFLVKYRCGRLHASLRRPSLEQLLDVGAGGGGRGDSDDWPAFRDVDDGVGDVG